VGGLDLSSQNERGGRGESPLEGNKQETGGGMKRRRQGDWQGQGFGMRAKE